MHDIVWLHVCVAFSFYSWPLLQVKQFLEGDKKGLKDNMKIVLEKVRKNKPRAQKFSGMEGAGIKMRMWRGWKHVKQFFKGKRDESSERSVADRVSSSKQDIDETNSE